MIAPLLVTVVAIAPPSLPAPPQSVDDLSGLLVGGDEVAARRAIRGLDEQRADLELSAGLRSKHALVRVETYEALQPSDDPSDLAFVRLLAHVAGPGSPGTTSEPDPRGLADAWLVVAQHQRALRRPAPDEDPKGEVPAQEGYAPRADEEAATLLAVQRFCAGHPAETAEFLSSTRVTRALDPRFHPRVWIAFGASLRDATDDDATTLLAPYLASETAGARAFALVVLSARGALPAGLRPSLAGVLGDASPHVRLRAIDLAAQQAALDDAEVAALTAFAKSIDDAERLSAARVLERHGHAPDADLQRVAVQALRAKHPALRARALLALEPLGVPPSKAFGAVSRALRDKDPVCRRCAVRALSAYGEAAAPLAPQLRLMSEDEDGVVRISVAALLAELDG